MNGLADFTIRDESLRQLVENLHAVVWIISLAGEHLQVLYVNPAYEKIWGRPRRSLLEAPRSWLEAIHPEDHPEVAGIWQRSLQGDFLEEMEMEFRIVRPEGEIRWIQTRFFPLWPESGEGWRLGGFSLDVTRRRQAEEELQRRGESLRQSEQKYRLLVSNIPAVVFKGYADWAVDLFDDNLERFTGYPQETFNSRKMRWSEVILSEDLDQARRGFVQALKSKKPYVRQYRIRDRQGKIIWVEERGQIVYDPRGQFDYVSGVAFDITKQKVMEEALRQSEEKYRLLVNQVPAIIYKGYTDWSIDFFDEKIEGLSGYHKKDFDSRRVKWCNLILPEDMAQAQKSFVEALKTTRDYVRKYRIRRKDGEIRWVQCQGRIFLDAQGKVDYVSGVMFDITERQRAEEALTAEKERLAVTLRSIGDGVVATDTTGKIVLMNPVAERLTGWSQAEALGKAVSEVLPLLHEKTGRRHKDPVALVSRTGQAVSGSEDTVLLARDGSRHLLTYSGAPIIDQHHHILGVVLVFQEVTRKRQMEAELLKMEKLSSLGILAGGIAHDFNNIFTGILGNISLALLSCREDENLQRNLAEAEKATLRATELAKQLLTFAKGGEPVKEVASLREIIRESASFTCRGSQVRCEFSSLEELWPVEVDAGQIGQVIQNLVLNSIQAMPTGGIVSITGKNVRLSPQTVLPLPPGRYVKISVQDQGLGIPAEHLANIFDPYFTTKQKGSGLGLAIVYSIIKRHGGHITVESRLGAGTICHLYLPASLKKVEPKKEGSSEPVTGKGRILVMDDEELVREVAGKILTRLGYEVEFVGDGAEALERYQQALETEKPFDAVILDLTVPGGMGGEEAMQRLRKIDPRAKGIVSSGYADDPVMTRYQEFGFCAVIRKPYRVEDFSQVLQEIFKG